MSRFFLLTCLFLIVVETAAQKKRLWGIMVVTVQGTTRHIGLLHSINDSLISILPGFTRKKLQAAIEINEPFQIPLKAVKKVKLWRVRTVLGSTWEFLRLYAPIYTGASLLIRTHQPIELLAIHTGSGIAAITLESIISGRKFKPADPSFKYTIQRYCYYPSFRVPKEVKQRK